MSCVFPAVLSPVICFKVVFSLVLPGLSADHDFRGRRKKEGKIKCLVKAKGYCAVDRQSGSERVCFPGGGGGGGGKENMYCNCDV